jgi:hypothetical protein
MRGFFAALLVLSLAFAAGGGGSNVKTFALDHEYECSNGEFAVIASDPAGALSGVEVEIGRYGSGTALYSAQTGSDGRAVFTITQDGAYSVKGTKSGYSTAFLLASIKACKAEPGEAFYCTDKTLKERVSCIMDLPDSDVLNVKFVPEECRVMDEAGKKKCIETYRVLQSCRIGFEGDDEERENCIKPKLGLGENIWDDARDCNFGEACLEDLRQKVYILTKFRIYNLEYKVQEMVDEGLSREKAVDFIAYIEEAKARFNSAQTIAGKKAVVSEVKERWDVFVGDAMAELGVGG